MIAKLTPNSITPPRSHGCYNFNNIWPLVSIVQIAN